MGKDKFAALDAAKLEEVMDNAPLQEKSEPKSASETVDKLIKNIPVQYIKAIEKEEGKNQVSSYFRRALKRALKEDGLI